MSLNPDANFVKSLCLELGADVVGIAGADVFCEAPEATHPRSVLPSCKSVVVMACAFPHYAMDAEPAAYTAERNAVTRRMDQLTAKTAKKIGEYGFDAVKVGSISAKRIHGRAAGPISLKHAAVLAGLGAIGKNTLLINNVLGNMLWLGAVVTSMPLKSDRPAGYAVCPDTCGACIASCPCSALGTPMMEQRACYNHAFKTVKGKLEIQCWRCRSACPFRFGMPVDSRH